jgi:putative ABC transport system permease protein
VGILKTQVVQGIWLSPAAATALGYGETSAYLLTVGPGVSASVASQLTKAAFYPYGLVLIDFAQALASVTAVISGDIGLLELFIALGLAVGIAALGILALRAVTERRRQIGTLRATGLTRGMILKAFLLEYLYITLLGASMGLALGVLIMYNLVSGPFGASVGASHLFVPWSTLLLVLVVTGLLATAAVVGPSYRAAHVPPAQALRGLE